MFEFECRVSRTALSEGSGHHSQLDFGGRSNQMVQKYSLLGIWKQRDEDNSTEIGHLKIRVGELQPCWPIV